QETARGMLTAQLDSINRHDVRNAAIVVIENSNGAVRALASAGAPSEISGATIPRHAGSTLKPFVYLMGIDEKILTAASVFTDTPDAVARRYADYDPHNFNRGYRGPVRLREALANSMNIPAVLALEQIGARRCFFELEEWGLHKEESFEQLGAGFVLGNLRVRLLDLTAAYAGLARSGLAAPPQFFADRAPSPQRRIVAPEAVAIIEDILCDNDARAQAFGSDSPLDLGWRAAVKTGTSSSFRDSWTVGYCRDFTVGVWVGNYDGQSMAGKLAVETATPIWRRMMNHLKNRHGARPLEAPEPHDRLLAVNIDPLSGLLPVRNRQRELFLPGTAPSETGEQWYGGEDGKPQLPEPYANWIASKHNHLGASLQPAEDGTTPLTILSPSDGLTYVIDRDLPAAQQSVELKALTEAKNIEWVINGQTHEADHWQLQRGKWQVTARTESGAEAEVRFSVE
ncbi:MAG: penicillin-binding protein 1C, partial [Verrucomicrobiales bacterium]